MNLLSFIDPELAEAIEGEKARQNLTIELIASENFVPEVILEAQGSVLTNKYAEGYPGKRYHGGCRFIDVVESLAIERAKSLFGAEHANVQPHSGVNANLAVFMAMLEPGDVILGMDLRHGGHLSHGTAVNISGKFFRAFSYGVDRESGRIDYDEAERIALEHRPKMIIAGGSAYPRVIDFARFAEIADTVGAYFLVDMAHIAGLVAAGVHPSPVPHAHFVTFTTTKTMRGARGGNILCRKEFASRIDKAIFPGIQGGPIPQIMAGKALTFRLAMTEEFRNYGRRTVENAARFASVLMSRGFSLVSGGTDNHLMLVDLRSKGLTGREAEELLHAAGITVNMNLIPFDPEKPTVTSGIRIGLAGATSRGFTSADAEETALIACDLLEKKTAGGPSYRERVLRLCLDHPVYMTREELAASPFFTRDLL
ncbi:MAG: serine hydroxymethyltransferase [Aminivibrio sp.]|jgi:Glycine/serine hydroxymethyltransferase|nr:serine hydroxymethyltransferase [Aminivibrio sp.]